VPTGTDRAPICKTQRARLRPPEPAPAPRPQPRGRRPERLRRPLSAVRRGRPGPRGPRRRRARGVSPSRRCSRASSAISAARHSTSRSGAEVVSRKVMAWVFIGRVLGRGRRTLRESPRSGGLATRRRASSTSECGALSPLAPPCHGRGVCGLSSAIQGATVAKRARGAADRCDLICSCAHVLCQPIVRRSRP
jgi:hypothetical protein